ncbi:MAG: hypothetical protein GKR94_27220 [Gammaproteobacteria bacterium]|nr:hypothetical protein [Gammaproteobacteria bacterium]
MFKYCSPTKWSAVVNGLALKWIFDRWMKNQWTVLATLLCACAPAQVNAAATLDAITFVSLPGERLQMRLQLSEPIEDPLVFAVDNPARVAMDSSIARTASGSSAGQAPLAATGGAVQSDTVRRIENVDFRRGRNGQGRVLVTRSDPATIVDTRTEGDKVIIEYLDTVLPGWLECKRKLGYTGERLDIPVRQVLIESRIVVADTTFREELGVQLGVSRNDTLDNEDHQFIMDLSVNQDAVGQLFNNIPSIDTRAVDMQILVDNGETVVLGGIYQQTKRSDTRKVPLFGDLPYVGRLFRSDVDRDARSEPLIFITPRILKDSLWL